MSRVGKYPVALPDGVEAKITDGVFEAKGKFGTQSVKMLDYVDVTLGEGADGRNVTVTPRVLTKRARQNWGTMRALINNAVIGADRGFTRRLGLSGVGYRVASAGSNLKLSLGLSHEVVHPIPSDIKATIEGDRSPVIVLTGASKQRVGQVASDIKSYRRPEPYGGKGIRYEGEFILRKEGKKKKK